MIGKGKIICTVTNDLSYDQRMHRICSALVRAGYEVELVGRALPQSLPPEEQSFTQRRLHCRFHKGFLFYAEYNLRLLAYLLRAPCDAVCSVDLDTLPAGCLATLLRRKKRVFDAHEYFTEVPEVVQRPFVRTFWAGVARLFLPFYRQAYTVGPALAQLFTQKYAIPFAVVRNVPAAMPPQTPRPAGRVLLYQGALNAGRGIEQCLEALTLLPPELELWLAGEGDLSVQLRRRAAELGLENRARFLGYVKPAALKAITAQAWLGLNLLENRGLSYYYSLANKFFDCVQAQVPLLTMDFPEYRALNAQHEVALLLTDLNPEKIAVAIRRLQTEPGLYPRLQNACAAARQEWVWEVDERVLLEVWARAMQA